jgi:heme/copper-type cytochrome/quinol oxidase subunit 2
MSLVASAVLAAAGSIEEQPLPVPSVIFPIVALGVFALLALVAWSYRDVANSHRSASGHGSPQGHK